MYNRGTGHHKGGQKGQREGGMKGISRVVTHPTSSELKKNPKNLKLFSYSTLFITSSMHVYSFPYFQQFDCVSLKRGPADDIGKWNNEECYKHRGYICQKDSGELCIVNLENDNIKSKTNFLV